MSKFWAVFKREYTEVVKKKSFIVGLLLMPVLMSAFMVIPGLLARQKSSSTEHLAVIDMSGQGVGSRFEEALSKYTIEDSETPYYNVQRIFEIDAADTITIERIDDSLRQLVNQQSIRYYLYVGESAHVHDTAVYVVTNSDNFTSLNRFEYQVSNVLSEIRLEASGFDIPVDSVMQLTRRIDLRTQDAKGESIPFMIKYFSAMVFVMIMMGMILGYGQQVMRSILDEKNSRIMEVLVSSVTPFRLMLGKILGLGAATLTQVLIWFALGGVLYGFRASIDIDPSIYRIVFEPVILVFFVLNFIAGYILFSTVFALLGSIVNSEKEAQNFVAPISLVLVIPIIFAVSVVQEPNSTLATVLSLVPLTAPTMMTMRLIFVVPTLSEFSLLSGIGGQAVLALVLVVLTIVVMVWLTSKIFRVGILMYGKRPTLPEIVKWIRY